MSHTSKVRMGDRRGEQRETVAVEWHARGCRHRLLRVFLTPDGWHVLGDSFKEHPREWLNRVRPEVEGVPLTLADRDAGKAAFPTLRKVRGVDRTLAHDTSGWDAVTFEVGCGHGTTTGSTSALAEQCLEFRRTRRKVVLTQDVGGIR